MEARLLVACKACRRQYEVGGMSAGEHVRCRCGELVTVPKARPHEARVLHCSGCGGKLRDKALRCDYCGVEITAAERNLGPACPECFARLAGGARHCSECGIAIRPEAIRTTRASARCPRCKGDLVLRELERGHYTECTSCGGIWLDPDSFQRVLDAKDGSALPDLHPFTGGSNERSRLENPVKYLPCPICATMMNRKNFSGSGVIIDWCKGHGLWFDVFELERVVSFVTSGGLDRARKLELEAVKRRLDDARARERSSSPSLGGGWPDASTSRGDWVSLLAVIFRVVAGMLR